MPDINDLIDRINAMPDSELTDIERDMRNGLLTPGPTGPLPRGWHRITFRKTGWTNTTPPFYVVSEDLPSMTVLEVTLEADPDVVPGSITRESWSDFPPETRA